MLEIKNKQLYYDFSKCQQCGICKAVCPSSAISFTLHKNGLHEIVIDREKCITCGKCVKSCPANKVNSYKDYFTDFFKKRYYLGYNKNKAIRRASSSGGVCKTLIIEALKSGVVDGVYSLKQTDVFPFAEGEFYTRENMPSYEGMPNSIYHSVMACTEISKIKPCKRLMLVGTACQLRALNTIIANKCEEVIRVCIFCKQQKTLDSTRFLAKIMGAKNVDFQNNCLRYRGEGWPGIVRVKESVLPWNRAAQIPFGRRLWTVPGCDVCGDSFGKNAGADLTLMDPWKIRKPNDLGETLITVFTQKGQHLLDNVENIELSLQEFDFVKVALGLKDVWAKQQTEPYFRGCDCDERIRRAGEAEIKQRQFVYKIVNSLPPMPIIFYRILCKFPLDKRSCILKKI